MDSVENQTAFFFSQLQLIQQERYQTESENLSRRGNLDFYFSDFEQQEIGLCHFIAALPFTDGIRNPWNNVGVYEGVVAIALALDHLNQGNGTIVREVDKLSDRCPLRFSLELSDTELKESVALNHVIDATNRAFNNRETIHPCAFLGAARSAVSIPTSIVTGLRGYPQMSPISTAATLNDKAQFPLFSRTIPSDDGTAVALVLYFRDVLRVRNIGVLHINDSYGNSFAQGIRTAALQLSPDMIIQTIDVPVDATQEEISRAVAFLRSTKFTYFFGIVFPTRILDILLEEAYRQGIAGDGAHVWLFSDSVGGDIESRSYATGSLLDRAVQGTALFSPSAGLADENAKLALLTNTLKELKNDPESLAFIDSLLPRYLDDENFGRGFDLNAESFLQSIGYIGGFMYDGVIAMGLAACQSWEDGSNVNVLTQNIFQGKDHFSSLLKTSFEGTTGKVIFERTGTRTANSAFYQILNYAQDKNRSTIERSRYSEIMTHFYQEGEWKIVQPFVFNDGTTTPPPDLLPVATEIRTFSPGVRAAGLILCLISLTTAAGFAGWTRYYRKERVLTASQPFFLYLVCLGAGVMSLTIIPLSIDTGVASLQGCDVACRCIPWLLSLGFSVLCTALFTKTFRINRIFAGGAVFRRVVVKPLDVAKPMFFLLFANVIILSLWTIFSPTEWSFVTLEEDELGRPTLQHGRCESARGSLKFILAIAVLNFAALVLAGFQAYKARHISIQYAETDYIFLSMMVFVIVCLLGIPVLILARNNPDAYFFVFSGLVFVTTMVISMLIFIPKVFFLIQSKRNEEGFAHIPPKDRSIQLMDGSTITKQAPNRAFSHSRTADLVSPRRKKQRMSILDYESSKSSSGEEMGLMVMTKKNKRELLADIIELKLRVKKYKSILKENSIASSGDTNNVLIPKQEMLYLIDSIQDESSAEIKNPIRSLSLVDSNEENHPSTEEMAEMIGDDDYDKDEQA